LFVQISRVFSSNLFLEDLDWKSRTKLSENFGFSNWKIKKFIHRKFPWKTCNFENQKIHFINSETKFSNIISFPIKSPPKRITICSSFKWKLGHNSITNKWNVESDPPKYLQNYWEIGPTKQFIFLSITFL
jgi:hypothetical protein